MSRSELWISAVDLLRKLSMKAALKFIGRERDGKRHQQPIQRNGLLSQAVFYHRKPTHCMHRLLPERLGLMEKAGDTFWMSQFMASSPVFRLTMLNRTGYIAMT